MLLKGTMRGLGILAAVLLLAAPAHADHLDQWGNEAQTVTYDCPSFCTNGNFVTDGDVLDPNAFATISDSRGNASASSEFSTASGISTPLLKAEAFSTGPAPTDNSANSFAFGVEGYTYTGAAPKTINIDVTLTGDMSDPSDENVNEIRAEILACEADTFFYSPFSQCDIGEGIGGSPPLAGEFLLIEQTETSAVRTGLLSFTIFPGESFYLRARLDAVANRDGASADAFSTLTMSFQDSSGLVPASTGAPHVAAVPLLPSLWLAAAAVMLLAVAAWSMRQRIS